jgi:hypothetical protein
MAKPNLRNVGVVSRTLPGGTSLNVTRQRAIRAARTPLFAYSIGGGEWQVTPGNVNGSPVTDSAGEPLSGDPAVGTHQDGKVYLEIVATLTFTDGYLVLPTTISTAKIKAGNSVPANSGSGSGTWTWNIELATLEDGIPTGNTFTGSMYYFIEDASTDSTESAVLKGLRA